MIRTTILLICFGLFLVNAKAQGSAYPNEIQGFQFSKQDKVKDLKLLVSTGEEVMALFGKDCLNRCQFNEDWDIGFAYVNSGWSRTTTENGLTTVYKPRPEFVGKLADITFRPRRPIVLPESLVFPKGLKCDKGLTTSGNLRFKSIRCADDQILSYLIYDETTDEGKFQKHQLVYISYARAEQAIKDIFVLESVALAP